MEIKREESAFIIERLTVKYEEHVALNDISLNIKRNSITAIIGPSGCGKSTLLSCLNGYIFDVEGAKMTGEVALFDRDVKKIPMEELHRRVGLVFQTPTPFPFSIYKNMTYAPKYMGIKDKKTLDEIVTSRLQMAGLYDEVKDNLKKNANKLSGGQKQRLCIARALTANPEVLLLDEPCSALDVKSTAIIEDMLLKLKEKYTLVIVTHNIHEANRIADNVLFLDEGTIVEYATKEEIFSNPKDIRTKEFLMN